MLRLTLAAAAAALWTAAPAQAAPCDALASLKLPADVRVVRATPVTPADRFVPPKVADAKPIATPFCRVEGVIETEIGFELWLPERWSGRFLAGGVGGQAGQYNYRDMVRGIARGYAAASTDTGHKADDRHWLLGTPERAANYAGRSNHLLAQRAKAVVAAFYRAPIRTALFVGCSGGGRQALTEAQRYPEDYDGILAGAPGVNTPEMSARRMWEMVQHSAAGDLMPLTAWSRIADAGIAACDGKDGVRDGVVEDAGACRYSIASLSCARSKVVGCLTEAQARFAERLYAPLHDENGRRIDDGLLPGTRILPQIAPEPFTPGPTYLAVALFGDGVHRDPNWDPRTFQIADDLPAIDKVMDLHANDPDIRPFVRRGGKLLLYQGWADPFVAASPTIAYHDAVRSRLGSAAGRSVRLFMVPGMEHCVGGNATDRFGGAGSDGTAVDPEHDMLAALEAWVERGRVPERIEAAKMVKEVSVRTRPLCAWPRRAFYSGRGSTDQAASFVCLRERLRRRPPRTGLR